MGIATNEKSVQPWPVADPSPGVTQLWRFDGFAKLMSSLSAAPSWGFPMPAACASRPRCQREQLRFICLVVAVLTGAVAQFGCGNEALDNGFTPSRTRTILPEQYIWIGSPSPDSSSPRFFRNTFVLNSLPTQATLYFLGPFNFDIFVNGMNVSHVQQGRPTIIHDQPVVVLDVTEYLRTGINTAAIQASAGGLLAIKILPEPQGIDGRGLLLSDASWRGTTVPTTGWEQPQFDDSLWSAVQAFGSIESDIHHFQGYFDLGMYQWPGYEGLSGILDHTPLSASAVLAIAPNGAAFSDPLVLTSASDDQNFRVTLSSDTQRSPSLMLDFGKEVAGRLEVARDPSRVAGGRGSD